MISAGSDDGWRYYLRLGANSFTTMLDLGLFALGASLVGAGMALLLAGFGVVGRDTGLSTGAGLVSALVLGVVGTFSIGIASEGPTRRNNLAVGSTELEQAAARAVASVAVGLLLIALASLLSDYVSDLPAPIGAGVGLIRSAGVAGIWPVPLIGIALAWGIRRAGIVGENGPELELPIMFSVWVVALILLR
jgi:hypothetical protein